MSKDIIIKTEGLGKCYRDPEEKWVVKNVELSIAKGEFVSVVGRSGSGKSTLLKMMGGLLKPEAGRVLIGTDDIYKFSAKAMADYRCNRIGFVFQDYFLEEKYTVYQNVEVVLMIAKVDVKKRKDLVSKALMLVGMEDKKDSYVKNLSGGEKQRVCIARAIVNDPDIIYADEPCGNLDYENGANIMRILRELTEKGKTVVLITHNREDAANTDRIITLQDGKVIADEAKG